MRSREGAIPDSMLAPRNAAPRCATRVLRRCRGVRPRAQENLCLYGNPDATWEVTLPAEEVPPELPEPALGINFARDGMQARARCAAAPCSAGPHTQTIGDLTRDPLARSKRTGSPW